MKRLIDWMRRGDNALFAGIYAAVLLAGAFLWAYSAYHDAHCDGCDWFWCHGYSGGGDL